MLVFKIPFNNYSVKFIPLYKDHLAVAIAQNFGILANGRLHVLSLSQNPSQPFTELATYDTADGIYGLTWSESHDFLIIAAVADGSVELCDTALPASSNPIPPFANTPARSTPPRLLPHSLLGRHRQTFLAFTWLRVSMQELQQATSDICLVSSAGLWFMVWE